MTTEGGEGGFLSRWSRRKQASRTAEDPSPAYPPGPEQAPPALPDIETLGAASDYRAFLQAGVSAAVQAQALRRAWASDAAIAGFRGMADYDWDFNAAGYGRLRASDDVASLLKAVLDGAPGAVPADPAPVAAPDALPAGEPPTVRLSAVVPDTPEEPASPDPPVADEGGAGPDAGRPAPARRHGSAMPS